MFKNNKLVYIVLFCTTSIMVCAGTFAYFTASDTSSGAALGGGAADFNVSLDVETIYNNSYLIPMDDEYVDMASDNKMDNDTNSVISSSHYCKDDNGYSVCQMYKIKITNNSDNQFVRLNGTVLFNRTSDKSGDTYLKYRMYCVGMCDDTTNLFYNGETVSFGNEQTMGNYFEVSKGNTKEFYLVIWLSNDDVKQDNNIGNYDAIITISGVSGDVLSKKISGAIL